VNHRGRVTLAGAVTVLLCGAWLAGATVTGAQAPRPAGSPSRPGGQGSAGGHHHHDHDHPPVPAAYAGAEVPVGAWTDPQMIARGKAIYVAKCAVCHGERGDGNGPGAANLRPRPAAFTDRHMMAEMAGNYWLWRVSEGGLAEPFRSRGSAMPAWKDELSLDDRWAVIAYSHTLSGHRGPHTASEHPELKPKPRTVTGQGTVVAVRRDRQQIVLEHGEITGFMDAMTMGYRVSPLSLLDRVKAGDRVRFTIDTEARAIIQLEAVKE
jgi:mono/diheme cytochrome c family protein